MYKSSSRPVMQSGKFKTHGNYRANKTTPATNALSNASGVVKAGMSPVTAEPKDDRVASPRRSGKWKAYTINSRLSYRGAGVWA